MFSNISIISNKCLLATFVILVFVQLSISQSEETNTDVSESWGSTDFKISRLKYTWTINNFWGDLMTQSSDFSVQDGCKWYLRFELKNKDNTKNFALFLHSRDCDKSTTVKLGILNDQKELTNVKEFSHEYKPGNSWGYENFISQAFLFNTENKLLPEKKLTIICEIIALEGKENSSGQTEHKSDLVQDFEFLLDSQAFSDVTLAADGREFKVHKAILAARSPVFKAMFDDDSEKGQNKLVNITDLDSKTLSEMLHYIYTDEKPDLKKLKLMSNLLGAAENYKIDALKTLCGNALISGLSLENAVEFFVLGDKYRAADLKTQAKHFILSHKSDITNTASFKSLISSEPRLALEIFKMFR